jgi:hypothetical protein
MHVQLLLCKTVPFSAQNPKKIEQNHNRQSKRLSPLRSWVGFSLRTHAWHLCEKSQSMLYRKSWVFSGYSGVLPQGMLTGWVEIIPLTDPSRDRSCAPWSDMSHKVAARGAFRKPSTRSGWAASLVIQLSSRLQVRMISILHLPLTYLECFFKKSLSHQYSLSSIQLHYAKSYRPTLKCITNMYVNNRRVSENF